MPALRLVAPALLLLAGCARNAVLHTTGPDPSFRVAVRREGRHTCVAAGSESQCHDAVALRQIVFAPVGRGVAYPARDGARWRVVRDFRPGPPFAGVAAPVYSPDGTRLAYAAHDGAGWRVVVDDSAGARFDSLFTGTIGFDATGRHLGYVARSDGSAFAVVDGVAGRPWAGVARLSFGEAGGHFVYHARSADGAYLVLDHAPLARHDAVGPAAVGGDGAVVYAAREAAQWFVIAPGQRRGPFDSVGAVARAAAGPAWGFVAHDSAGSVVVVNGTVVAREPWAGSLALTARGARFAYLARRGGRGVVVTDSGLAGSYGVVVDGTLVWLDDGHTWAVLAGERDPRRLYLVLSGSARRKPFDWQVSASAADHPDPAFVLRAWIRAQGERALRQAR